MGETFRTCGLPTRIGFSACVAVWVTGLLWLVTRDALVGVFILGGVVGLYMIENWSLKAEVHELQEGTAELEKQMVVLRTAVHELSLANSELEVECRRALFRRGLTRGGSCNSL